MAQAVFAPGRIVWKAPGVSDKIGLPNRHDKDRQRPSADWLLGEALTNIYVGLLRDHRGEKLSAMRFIQVHAVNHILELSDRVETAVSVPQDTFSPERRYELRYPSMAELLPAFLQGYGRNRESALAALSFLDECFDVSAAMKQAILKLCQHDLMFKD